MEPLRELFLDALRIWRSGGWGMIALGINGLVMYTLGFSTLFKLIGKGLFCNPERAWQGWHARKGRVRGTAGRIIRGAMDCSSMENVEHYFSEVRGDEVTPFERDLAVMHVSVSAAPLLGLLGTVTGMLNTFSAMAIGGGGDKTMGMVAGGISEALITTETGLVLALSGVMFEYVLLRQHEKFGKVVAHLETLSMQFFHRQERALAAVAI